jgi:hypothetical protein
VVEGVDPQLTFLGSFDPLTLMLEFSGQYRVSPPEGPRFDPDHGFKHTLRRVPTSVLAHELAHVVHTLGTAAGLRQYLIMVETFLSRLDLISAAVEAADGEVLRLPIVPNLHVYAQTERLTNAATVLSAHLVAGAAYAGGYREDEPDHNINLTWLQSHTRLGGFELGWPTCHCYLGHHTGQPQSVVAGYRHLTEGIAKIVERMQRRFTGEEGEQSPQGTVLLSAEQFADHRSSPFDPYYVAAAVFHSAKLFENPDTHVAGYEDYVAVLADIAMMVDPLVTPTAFSEIFGPLSPDVLDAAKMGYSPFMLYQRLCHLFWRSVEELPLLDAGDMRLTGKVAALQNAVLAAAGSDLTMRDMTLETLKSLTRFEYLLDAQVFTNSTQSRDVYRRGFERVLAWRADVLDGSAIYEDLLTGRDKLLDHSRWWSPTYAIGGDLYSAFDVRPGEGVAVDQANIQMLRSVLDAICFRNAPCELRGPPRGDTCALPPIGLCSRIPNRLRPKDQDPYCVRDLFTGVLRSLG